MGIQAIMMGIWEVQVVSRGVQRVVLTFGCCYLATCFGGFYDVVANCQCIPANGISNVMFDRPSNKSSWESEHTGPASARVHRASIICQGLGKAEGMGRLVCNVCGF